jgi:hypothetical protein
MLNLRRRPDSNRSTGLCRPLPNHSATPPELTILLGGQVLLAFLKESPDEITECDNHYHFNDEGQRGDHCANNRNNRGDYHDGQNDQEHDS